MAEFIEYGEATDVWVEEDYVFTRRQDGVIVRMSPEVAIAIGRKLEAAGTDSFINKVMDGNLGMGDADQPDLARLTNDQLVDAYEVNRDEPSDIASDRLLAEIHRRRLNV